MKRVFTTQRGAVMLSALGVMLFCFLFLSSFMALNALRARTISRDARSLKVYYAARAGVESGLVFISAGEREEGGEPLGEIVLSGDEGRRAPVNAKIFIYFHDRGKGFFSGKVFEGAFCEVSWEKVGAGGYGEVYLIKSTGIIKGKNSVDSRRTVYALAEKINGRAHINNWFE